MRSTGTISPDTSTKQNCQHRNSRPSQAAQTIGKAKEEVQDREAKGTATARQIVPRTAPAFEANHSVNRGPAVGIKKTGNQLKSQMVSKKTANPPKVITRFRAGRRATRSWADPSNLNANPNAGSR